MNLRRHLDERLSAALREASGLDDAPAMVAPAGRPEFGDYQANGVMAAAKRLKTNPRQLAEKVVAVAAAGELAEMVEPMKVAGPGFINIRLKAEWLARELSARLADAVEAETAGQPPRLGVEPAPQPQTVVVDYSAPNLAKEMHVGHLRSTIIGDALARTLYALGHRVVRQNHVGDWGTQFGMLVAYMDVLGAKAAPANGFGGVAHIGDLDEYYRCAKREFDANPAFAGMSREYVVKLQTGDPKVLQSWRHFLLLSWHHCHDVYERLRVSLTIDDLRGESFYGGIRDSAYERNHNYLPKVVLRLRERKILSESEGARCVFLEEFKGKDGAPLPLIVQKSDEGYLYATTDLAAIWFRCGKGKADGAVDWSADRILYVVDARQALHFRMVFAVARKAGFASPAVSLEHVAFGTMQGADGKPFKTRTGGTVKLMDLLDDAEGRAYELVQAKSAERDDRLDEDKLRGIARVVGIGAVKYADLSQNRTSDYAFSFDRMLALDGNTAPYMQYAYARIRSILRKSGQDPKSEIRNPKLLLDSPAERALAAKLVQFPEIVQTVADECLPNVLCAYLYDLAVAFTAFYEACPVLKSDQLLRSSRLALCDLTARTIRRGLDLLGIETVEQM